MFLLCTKSRFFPFELAGQFGRLCNVPLSHRLWHNKYKVQFPDRDIFSFMRSGNVSISFWRQYMALFPSITTVISLLLTSDRKSSRWYAEFGRELEWVFGNPQYSPPATQIENSSTVNYTSRCNSPTVVREEIIPMVWFGYENHMTNYTQDIRLTDSNHTLVILWRMEWFDCYNVLTPNHIYILLLPRF